MRNIHRLIWVLAISSGVALASSNPVPFVNQPLVPDCAMPGSKGFVLTVNGTGFASSAVIKWNGNSLTTTFVNQGQLTAQIPASYVAKPQTATVVVRNPAPGGGTSNPAYFEVALPAPAISMVTKEFNESTPINLFTGGDFNGDGKLDIAGTTYSGGSEILVSLGNGNGTFQKPVSTNVNTSIAYGMVTGDFNNDGKLDLAFINTDSTFSVVLGKGNGTFTHQRTYNTDEEPNLGVGDFNGDGKLDIATSGFRDQEVSIYLGNGDGTFQNPINTTVGDSPGQFAVGDFNGDGKLDIAVLEANSWEVTILLGNGDGTFAIGGEYFLNDWPGQIAAADVNGDGKLDLIVGATEFIQEFLGNGDGTFQNSKTIWHTNNRLGFGLVNLADMDAHDKLDIVGFADMGDGDNLGLFNGNGNGTFQRPLWSIPTSVSGTAVLGDFNNDGRPDLIMSPYNGQGDYDVSLLQSPGVLMPALFHFGIELIGGKNPPKTLTLTNTGVASLKIASIKVTGQNAGDFSQTNNCPANLPSRSQCRIRVTFSPSQENQPEQAAVQISHVRASDTQFVPLFGQGTVIKVSPRELNFGNIRIGHESRPQRIILVNTSNQAIQFNTIHIKGPTDASFFESNNCGSGLSAGGRCEIMVTFIPSSPGPKRADVIIQFNNDNPPPVALKGTGTR